MDTGALTRKARQATQLTQREFARLVGISPITVSLWETGTRRPSPMARSLLHLVAQDGPKAIELLRQLHDGDGARRRVSRPRPKV
jgi:DNA-binding transcriptional regulator YiaG